MNCQIKTYDAILERERDVLFSTQLKFILKLIFEAKKIFKIFFYRNSSTITTTNFLEIWLKYTLIYSENFKTKIRVVF